MKKVSKTITMNTNDIIPLRQANSLYTRNEIDLFNRLNRFGYLDPYNKVNSTREYIFFSKPDLHLYDGGDSSVLNPEIASIPFFRDVGERYNRVLKQLQISHLNNNSPFINLISNLVKSELDLPQISASDVETASNVYGDTITYRWSSGSSDNQHEFSLEFEDTKYLDLYMLLKVWDEYERKKSKGGITPPNDNYIINKVLHDQVCAYKFIVGEDGESIIYFAKLWGVYPKTVPREAFSSMDKGGGLTYNVSFHAEYVEDMDPMIIMDFNNLSNKFAIGNDMPLYDSKNKIMNGKWARLPYIAYDSDVTLHPNPMYKLKWRG